MALHKTITSGTTHLPLSYHRIAQIVEEVNFETSIHVLSYLDRAEREREIDADEPVPVYYEERRIILEGHEGSITVQDAYEWLKSQPEFEDAEDVLEEGQ